MSDEPLVVSRQPHQALPAGRRPARCTRWTASPCRSHEQEIVGLVGESGSGKSTYGKTLIGLHDKTSGTVTYRGEQLPQHYRAAGLPALRAPHADDLSGSLLVAESAHDRGRDHR